MHNERVKEEILVVTIALLSLLLEMSTQQPPLTTMHLTIVTLDPF